MHNIKNVFFIIITAHLAGVGNKPSTAPRTPGIHSSLHHDAYRVTTIDHCITTADGEEKRLLPLGIFACVFIFIVISDSMNVTHTLMGCIQIPNLFCYIRF